MLNSVHKMYQQIIPISKLTLKGTNAVTHEVVTEPYHCFCYSMHCYWDYYSFCLVVDHWWYVTKRCTVYVSLLGHPCNNSVFVLLSVKSLFNFLKGLIIKNSLSENLNISQPHDSSFDDAISVQHLDGQSFFLPPCIYVVDQHYV